MYLPASLGVGALRSLVPEPGLLLTVHRYSLARELTLNRPTNSVLTNRLLVFICYGPHALPHFQLAYATTAGRRPLRCPPVPRWLLSRWCASGWPQSILQLKTWKGPRLGEWPC